MPTHQNGHWLKVVQNNLATLPVCSYDTEDSTLDASLGSSKVMYAVNKTERETWPDHHSVVSTLAWSTVYWEILAAIKFGEMARNCLDKCLANLKFGNSHDQIESYDIITRAALGHLKPL